MFWLNDFQESQMFSRKRRQVLTAKKIIPFSKNTPFILLLAILCSKEHHGLSKWKKEESLLPNHVYIVPEFEPFPFYYWIHSFNEKIIVQTRS